MPRARRTCLCHGVPASQSRSVPDVSSLGATPSTTLSGDGEAEAVRQADVAGCIASVISTGASTDPRRVTTRTRPPASTPRLAASSGFMRSATPPSFFRHAGSRKIVFAVDERRSPAERTNGNSSVGGNVRRQRRELLEQLGDHEVDLAVGRVEALPGLVVVVDGEHDAGTGWRASRRRARRRRRSRRAAPTRDATGSRSARDPTPRPRLRGPRPASGRASRRGRRRERREVRLLDHRRRGTRRRTRPGPARRPRAARRGRRRCRRRARAPAARWISGSGSVPGSGSRIGARSWNDVLRELEREERRLPLLVLRRRRAARSRRSARSRSSRRRSPRRSRARRAPRACAGCRPASAPGCALSTIIARNRLGWSVRISSGITALGMRPVMMRWPPTGLRRSPPPLPPPPRLAKRVWMFIPPCFAKLPVSR